MVVESPVIIIPGFMQTSLFDENSELVWFPEVGKITRSLMKNILRYLSPFSARLKKGHGMGAELFARVLCESS